MSWIYLFVAGILEIGWAYGLKQTHGFSRLWPSVVTVLMMISSFAFLSLALKQIPLGTAYAVWTGIGAAGTAAVGIVVLDEPKNAARLACIALIILAVLGLKFSAAK